MNLKFIYLGIYIGLGYLLLGPCSAQDNATSQVGTGAICTTEQIEKGDLQGCTCSAGNDKGPTCNKCPLGQCYGINLDSVSRLSTCGQGCIEGNHECDSCFIWFDQLCNCVKYDNCPKFTSATGASTWVKIASGKLITTTEHTPGILELHSEAPWEWGQSTLDRQNKALAINSVKTRTQEQIHVHDCPVKEIAQRILASQNYDNFKTIAAINMPVATDPNPWRCKVNPNQGQPIDRVTADLQAEIGKSSCKNYIGAAVVVDSNDRTWECVTTDDQPTQYTFCHPDPPGS